MPKMAVFASCLVDSRQTESTLAKYPALRQRYAGIVPLVFYNEALWRISHSSRPCTIQSRSSRCPMKTSVVRRGSNARQIVPPLI
jgi:hypothetical protein